MGSASPFTSPLRRPPPPTGTHTSANPEADQMPFLKPEQQPPRVQDRRRCHQKEMRRRRSLRRKLILTAAFSTPPLPAILFFFSFSFQSIAYLQEISCVTGQSRAAERKMADSPMLSVQHVGNVSKCEMPPPHTPPAPTDISYHERRMLLTENVSSPNACAAAACRPCVLASTLMSQILHNIRKTVPYATVSTEKQ